MDAPVIPKYVLLFPLSLPAVDLSGPAGDIWPAFWVIDYITTFKVVSSQQTDLFPWPFNLTNYRDPKDPESGTPPHDVIVHACTNWSRLWPHSSNDPNPNITQYARHISHLCYTIIDLLLYIYCREHPKVSRFADVKQPSQAVLLARLRDDVRVDGQQPIRGASCYLPTTPIHRPPSSIPVHSSRPCSYCSCPAARPVVLINPCAGRMLGP